MQSVIYSQKGNKSEKNEDACLSLPMKGLFAVADGVGGGPSGDFASRAIVNILCDEFASEQASRESILATLEKANDHVYQASIQNNLKGMASTVVVGWACNGNLTCFNVGDSRLYLVRKGNIQRLTRDHVRPVQKAPNIIKQMVTNAVGVKRELKVEVSEYPVQIGDLLLLMSDGISDLLDDERILQIAGNKEISLADRAKSLVSESERCGGMDDKSIILVALENGAAGHESQVE